MSRLDEPVDRPFLVEVAALVDAAHRPREDGRLPRGCINCTADGCERVTWAAPILAAHRQRRAAACRR
ncbi:hypothetical protein M3G91_25000 [Micromonospora chalcea]|uniref:hypothetical protein n=1 Tax=Micromonospora chalcea TaxID=1874 RepID=UPI0021A68D16|nr:hypothetical protein [Micromonospora chalcea]MCT2280878.1 hypothetical protein [Micromonospora chalcea]